MVLRTSTGPRAIHPRRCGPPRPTLAFGHVPETNVSLAQTEDDVTAIAKRWKSKRGSLIMALHALQDRYGYVPREAAMNLGEQMDVPLAWSRPVSTWCPCAWARRAI